MRAVPKGDTNKHSGIHSRAAAAIHYMGIEYRPRLGRLSFMTFELPRNFPHRNYTIPGGAVAYRVPRYISRVDIFEPGYAGTHGWQVRYSNLASFFGDSRCSKDANPASSLLAATTYLAAMYAGPHSNVRQTSTARKLNPDLPHGVRLVWRHLTGKSFKELYAEAYSPQKGQPARRVYVGTEQTVTPARIKNAIGKAVKLRKALVDEYLLKIVLSGKG